MKKILLVFGTRPEAIKMAPLVKALEKQTSEFETRVCVTGRHREMLDQVLHVFGITPDFDLNVMGKNQDLTDITVKVLIGMRDVFTRWRPDIVLVHGDTTTSMAVSMAAFYAQIKIGHVEAGLRTYNLQSPWPEEMNRQVTDRICDYYFAPTEESKGNLLKEGGDPAKIYVTGNTVIDALLSVVARFQSDAQFCSSIHQTILSKGYCISQRRFILVTGHRRENLGIGFQNICKALALLSEKYSTVDIVYPVHLNPNVRKPVFDLLSRYPNIYLIDPLDYLPFIYAMQKSYLILTDSGGVQEEAPSLGKPVLVMRDTTERPEALQAGTVKLVGTNADLIIHEVSLLIDFQENYRSMSSANNPYGDGKASFRIVDALR